MSDKDKQMTNLAHISYLIRVCLALAFTVWIITSPYSGWWIFLALIILF